MNPIVLHGIIFTLLAVMPFVSTGAQPATEICVSGAAQPHTNGRRGGALSPCSIPSNDGDMGGFLVGTKAGVSVVTDPLRAEVEALKGNKESKEDAARKHDAVSKNIDQIKKDFTEKISTVITKELQAKIEEAAAKKAKQNVMAELESQGLALDKDAAEKLREDAIVHACRNIEAALVRAKVVKNGVIDCKQP